jgi:hypothetical protein
MNTETASPGPVIAAARWSELSRATRHWNATWLWNVRSSFPSIGARAYIRRSRDVGGVSGRHARATWLSHSLGAGEPTTSRSPVEVHLRRAAAAEYAAALGGSTDVRSAVKPCPEPRWRSPLHHRTSPKSRYAIETRPASARDTAMDAPDVRLSIGIRTTSSSRLHLVGFGTRAQWALMR